MAYTGGITITGKAWKAGKNSLVLTIQKSAIKALNINEGDLIETELRVVHKQDKKQEELEKEEQTRAIKIQRK